ncbi:DUF4118 domain-containing protein [Aminithiophilus ramosus]|uniref:histidine kinase n=1 Tax=Aminithiophilus ramosus TaxID=3029084 RepID=A0A9Q7AN04_9BACT|nr:DUF4118 domain-containing protein [Aminithiophilus ramosus]QTX32467.1 DUF4118 domain-containing protein [Aminithiophilus ramosus]
MKSVDAHPVPSESPASRPERILVCLGPSPFGERLLREGLRMARASGGELWALHVEPPLPRQGEADRLSMEGNLRLAEELGARLFVRPGDDVAAVAADFARRHGVTRILAGKPLLPRWRTLLRGTLVDRMIRLSGSISVVAFSGVEALPPSRGDGPSPRAYGGGLALALAATAVGLPLSRVMAPANVVMVYLAAVLVAALFLGRGPSAVTAVVGVLAFDVFLVPPYYTLAVADSQYLVTFAGLLGVGLVVSGLASRAREQAREARRREEEALALHAFSRDLAAAASREAVVAAVTEHLSRMLGWDSALFLADGSGGLRAVTPLPPTAGLEAMVGDVHRLGRSQETTGGALGLPLEVPGEKVGVLVLFPRQESRSGRLRDTVVLQAAQALHHLLLDERAREAELLQVREKIQTALLNSISHEIRTPLSSITGVLSSLRGGAKAFAFDEASRSALIETAWSEARRLNGLVGNLLGMSRLEAGALRLALEPCDPAEIVAHVLDQMHERLEGREVETELPREACLVTVDFIFFSLVLVNLVDNALKYSPPGSPLALAVRRCGSASLVFDVLDRGPGIPEAFREKVFEKFFRLAPGGGGTGLGLAISKGIVEAHGGTLEALSRRDGGTVMRVTLPEAVEP